MTTVCAFCNIASGRAPASIVYEDANILAFMDLNPVNIGHTLVIPREHWVNIYDIPEKSLNEMATVVKRVSIAVKKTVGADGIKVIQLNERAAGQTVMHIHIHIIPTISKTRIIKRNHGHITRKRRDLDETAKKIRENL
jgi:histidine triad (HIT) family protein